jgi:hypothetical protein
MNNAVDVLHAFMTSYPSKHRSELTISKVNLLLYLIDWHLRINKRAGVSNLSWVNDSFGPSSLDVKNALERRSLFNKHVYNTNSGREAISHEAIGLAKPVSSDTKNSIDHVLKLNAQRRSVGASDPGAEFKRLVLSTYGVMHTEKGTPIDIQSQAMKYRKVKRLE